MTAKIQHLPPGEKLDRHRHRTPYAALVLTGSYEEAGDNARLVAGPGTLILHAPYESHRNWVGSAGSQVLNLPLSGRIASQFRTVLDADRIACLARTDPEAASRQALEDSTAIVTRADDWPDLLAEYLRTSAIVRLGEWADRHGLALGSLSRGFARVYGVTPKRFRFEWRARQALEDLWRRPDAVAAIACDRGFADQAHLHRSVRALTGMTPRELRVRG